MSTAGDSESEALPEPGPDSDRWKNLTPPGDWGVPSRESRSLDSTLLRWDGRADSWPPPPLLPFSSSGVWGRVGHSWSSTKMQSVAISVIKWRFSCARSTRKKRSAVQAVGREESIRK